MYITCSSIGNNGNFGNQLFQYAAVVGLAKKYGLTPILPRCQLHDCFELKENLNLTEEDYMIAVQDFKKIGCVTERIYHYDESIDVGIKNGINAKYDVVDLMGYFQTNKYCPNFKDLELGFNNKTMVGNTFLLENGMMRTPEPFVGIHVRRGDYLTLKDYHPPLSLEYYAKAVKKIQSQMQSDQIVFIVVSDDIEWCKTNLPPLSPTSVWLFPNLNKFNDFYCLSFCSRIIISNSTFSWWAAYYAQNHFRDNNMTIIAPRNWFGPALSRNDTKDLYQEGWTIID